MKPDYSGPNVSGVVPALLGVRPVSWLPAPVDDARATVLLVLDGLGWFAFDRYPECLPELGAFAGGPITTVVPSTTPAALDVDHHRAAAVAPRHHRVPLPSRPRRAQRHPVAARRRGPGAGTRARATPTGVRGAAGAGGHQGHVPHHRVHRRAPARRRVPRLADHVVAGGARPGDGRRWRPVRVRVLPGGRRDLARLRPRAAVLPGRAPGHRPTGGADPRRAPRRRRGAGHRRPRPGADPARRLAEPRPPAPDGRGLRGRRPVPVPARAAGRRRRPVRRRGAAPRRRRLGVPTRAAARRGLARPRPGVGDLPPCGRRGAGGPDRGGLRRSDACVRGAADRRPRVAHRGRDGGAPRGGPRSRAR